MLCFWNYVKFSGEIILYIAYGCKITSITPLQHLTPFRHEYALFEKASLEYIKIILYASMVCRVWKKDDIYYGCVDWL